MHYWPAEWVDAWQMGDDLRDRLMAQITLLNLQELVVAAFHAGFIAFPMLVGV